MPPSRLLPSRGKQADSWRSEQVVGGCLGEIAHRRRSCSSTSINPSRNFIWSQARASLTDDADGAPQEIIGQWASDCLPKSNVETAVATTTGLKASIGPKLKAYRAVLLQVRTAKAAPPSRKGRGLGRGSARRVTPECLCVDISAVTESSMSTKACSPIGLFCSECG
jgi:hypothetical protein